MPARCVAVAYSGGRDSSALLHATLGAACDLGLRVVALHVHHGLSRHADAWLAHCARTCHRWAARGLPVAFDLRRLVGRPPRGYSVEAWARSARYAALREMAQAHGAPIVLLAQHRRDQAETLLLQALRGAGAAGLAAMPRSMEREGVTWARPWLDVPAERVAAYVRRHRLRHIDDDSNADSRFARNRLRLQVWPALQAAFPDAERALAASAAWANEARQCADDLAAFDLAPIADGRGLDLARWEALSLPRRSNALRAWLREQAGVPAGAAVVQRLMLELPGLAPAQWQLGSMTLRRYRGRLDCQPGVLPTSTSLSARASTLNVARAGVYVLQGWGGRLRLRRVEAGGVARSRLIALRLVERSGGERFQAARGRPPRSLKKQFQAQAVPAWERNGPLIYSGDDLLYVPGLGIDARVIADRDVPQLNLEWLPDPP